MDKVDNLTVKVKLRRKERSMSLLSESKNTQFDEVLVAKWQEKVDTISM